MPYFSIVIPTYNRSKIIVETVSSILNQTFKDFEILIVDDGSTDNTKEVVDKLICQDSRIKYIFQKNSERSVARNNGINNAKGKYVCFLDSDDKFIDSHLQSLYDYIFKINEPKALIFTDQLIYSNGKIVDDELTISNIHNINFKEFFLKSSIVPGRVCIHNEILEKYKFDERITIVEDLDLWFIISTYFPVYYLPVKSFIYRIHEANSVNVSNNAYLTRLKGLKITLKKPESKSINLKIKRELLSNCYFGIYRFYVNKKQILRARLTLLKSILLYPEIRLKEKIYMLIYPNKIV